MDALFESFREQLQAEQDKRKEVKEAVNELDDTNRAFASALQSSHSDFRNGVFP